MARDVSRGAECYDFLVGTHDFWPVQVPKTLQNPQKSLHVTRNGNIWYIYQIIQF